MTAVAAFLFVEARTQTRRADDEAGRAEEQARRAEEAAVEAQARRREAESAAVTAESVAISRVNLALGLVLVLEGEATADLPTSRQRQVTAEALEAFDRRDFHRLPFETDRTGLLTTAEFSSDGRILATASQDTSVKLRDLASGDLLQDFTGHGRAVDQLEFIADDEIIVSTGIDRSIRIWTVEDAEELAALDLTESIAATAVHGSDGRATLATFDSGRAVLEIWDLLEAHVMTTFEISGAEVSLIAFSEDGETVAAAHSRGRPRATLSSRSAHPEPTRA